jgi:enterochelin esterase-like enzyme
VSVAPNKIFKKEKELWKWKHSCTVSLIPPVHHQVRKLQEVLHQKGFPQAFSGYTM